MTEKNMRIYRNLLSQLDKLARHNRQGSYKTRERYYEAMQRFCVFLAERFHLQKLSNLSGKHLEAYVRSMQAAGKSPSTIKTDLAAIRFWHDKLDTHHSLPTNDGLRVPLQRRRFCGVDRSWSPRELEDFCTYCRAHGAPVYGDIARLTYHTGLRIHECFRLDTAAAETALRTGMLTVKGKGGRVRSIPVSPEVTVLLAERLDQVPRGHKLYVADDDPTDKAIQRMQDFIRSARPQVRDPGSQRPMTHHGLRHSYAAGQYDHLRASGASHETARREVSQLLGHGRPDVTGIYLASATQTKPEPPQR